MGCVQSNASKLPVKTSKSRTSKRKEKQQLKKAGMWPPSPVVEDPAPWVEGHKTLVILKDGQGLFVQGDTALDAQ
ncbi:hypothetical protein BS17DRAFT_770938 [Gyrodon lividus]|nr:hypothetical protein BS17DRAFT_770938 [Gyrodon lividus]